MPLDPNAAATGERRDARCVDRDEAEDAMIAGPRGVAAESDVTVATVGLLHRVAERGVASVGPTTLRSLGDLINS
jgi:hypothetical protein